VNIRITRRKFTSWLGLAVAFFCAMGIVVEILSGHHQSRGWLVLFDLGEEWNFPTIYSALLLFLAAAVLLFIGVERRRNHGADFRHWIALSMIFCFLGFDEVLSIHNSAKHLVPVWFRHFALFDHRWDLRWIVIGLPVTVAIAIAFLPFVSRLPRRTACGIVIAGMVYVGAALGLEALAGWWIGQHGRNNWTYAAEVVVEETLEMVGALMFVDVLLAYTERELRGRARIGSVWLQLQPVRRPKPHATESRSLSHSAH